MNKWQDRLMLLVMALIGAGLAVLLFRWLGKWAFVILPMPALILTYVQIWQARSKR
jgi:hypothetical protein